MIKYINNINSSNITILIGNQDKNIILARSILSFFSSLCCLALIIIYIIYCLQIKFNLCLKKDENDTNELLEKEISSQNNEKKAKINKKGGNLGLGSNFMFLLTISNFFGAIVEFLFYFYYINKENNFPSNDNKNKLYYSINNDYTCHLYGFAHNFFDLFAVCWTTMLTLLFYSSTNLSSDMLYNDKKYLAIGFIFGIGSCFIFCLIPFATNSYGFAKYYCSFRYKEIDKKHNYNALEEKTINRIWRYSFVFVTFLTNFFNVICLIKTKRFYSKKLEITKKRNIKEYKLMLIYVWIFRIFPIVLIISRIFKGLSRVIIEKLNTNEFFENLIEYINAFFFASNGIFDSLACIFFFRGVFWCFEESKISDPATDDNKKESDTNSIGNEISDD